MQVARFAAAAAAESFPTATTISLLLRRSVHSLLPGGSFSLQSGSALAPETERFSSPLIDGRSSKGLGLREQEGHYPLSRGAAAASGGGGAEGGDWQLCGRGDKRTKKGKRFKGSFGNCRHRKNWDTQRLREKWEIPFGPAPGSLLPRPFPPLLTRY
ncbi:unnamed protein product [Calypogeia fissa]